MPYPDTIIAEVAVEASTTEIILGAFVLFIFLAGIIILAKWLNKTAGGRNALDDSPPRQNNMPIYLPFLLISIWVVWTIVVVLAIDFYSLTGWQRTRTTYIAFGIIEIITISFALVAGKKMFANGLKGFGLNPKNIPKDFVAAITNFLAVWPLIIVIMILVGYIGHLFQGEEFQMETNRGLEDLKAHTQLSVKLAVSIFAIFVVPIFEELTFRGLLQTTLRNFNTKPWPAIFITSAIFTILHPAMHWPALFVLAVCLGYAYEKKGSLFRPIFIHMIFNAISITATWLT